MKTATRVSSDKQREENTIAVFWPCPIEVAARQARAGRASALCGRAVEGVARRSVERQRHSSNRSAKRVFLVAPTRCSNTSMRSMPASTPDPADALSRPALSRS
jgi:hypothetical protein